MAKQKPIGEGRGKVGDVYRSGKYKGKTTDLSKKQVAGARRVGSAGRSGVGKKEAKAAMKSVSISDTTWKKASERTGPRAKGGILVGKDGKAITGTVTLASGKKATYVRGKRVQAAYKPTKSPSGGGGKKIPTTRVAPSVRGEGGAGSVRPSGASLTPRQQSAALRGEAAARRSNKPKGASAMTSSTIRAVGMAPPRPNTSAPKAGERRTRIVNGRQIVEKWDATKNRWVPLTVSLP